MRAESLLLALTITYLVGVSVLVAPPISCSRYWRLGRYGSQTPLKDSALCRGRLLRRLGRAILRMP